MNDDKLEFSVIISENFEEIRNNFKSGLKSRGYKYDEDILADTFIKCNSTLKDKKLTKKEAIKYFWVSYINTIKNDNKQNKKTVELSNKYDIINDEYNDDIDNLYNIIIKELYNKFGEKTTNIWIQYKFNKKTFKDILNTYDVDKDFQYTIKKIRKYLKNDLYKNKLIHNLIYDIRTT